MLYLSTKSHLVFPIKNPLSSSSKTHTTLAREPRNDFTRGQNLCWPHLGLHDTRGYTCENLSFTEEKTIGYEKSWICDKKWKEKTAPGGEKNAHKQKHVFLLLIWLRSPPKTSVLLRQNHRLRKITSKNVFFGGFVFSSVLRQKSNIFMFTSEVWRPANLCFTEAKP